MSQENNCNCSECRMRKGNPVPPDEAGPPPKPLKAKWPDGLRLEEGRGEMWAESNEYDRVDHHDVGLGDPPLSSTAYRALVQGCSRCGENHHVVFDKLSNHEKYDYWANCPITNQPILMKVASRKEDWDIRFAEGLEKVIDEWVEDRDNESHQKIFKTCNEIRDMLLEKNRKYGDSVLNPVRIFSKAEPVEQLLVRLDDKLSRLRSSQLDEDEDVIKDLIGYLIMLRIAMAKE